MNARYLSPLVVLTCAACSASGPTDSNGLVRVVTSGDTVTMSAERGVAIAHDSLTAVDQQVLPWRAPDSASVHVQVTGGMLTFYAAASYADMGNTPDGPRPVACVQEVPNGSSIGFNNVVTLTDGETYLLLPCTAGYYTITLTEQLGYADGSMATQQVTLSTGRYGWQRGLLSLTGDGTASAASASLSGATIAVTVPGHRYAFVALPRP